MLKMHKKARSDLERALAIGVTRVWGAGKTENAGRVFRRSFLPLQVACF